MPSLNSKIKQNPQSETIQIYNYRSSPQIQNFLIHKYPKSLISNHNIFIQTQTQSTKSTLLPSPSPPPQIQTSLSSFKQSYYL